MRLESENAITAPTFADFEESFASKIILLYLLKAWNLAW